MEAERDEARRQLEEEHRLHMAARHQAAVALRLEQQHQSHKAGHDQHEHDHAHDQHTHCDHDHDHSGEEVAVFFVCNCENESTGGFLSLSVGCWYCNPIGR